MIILQFWVNSVLKSFLGGFNHEQKNLIDENTNEFYQRGLTIINFLRICGRLASKLEKNVAFFFKFQAISIHANRSDRLQETVSVPSNSL